MCMQDLKNVVVISKFITTTYDYTFDHTNWNLPIRDPP